MEVEWFVQESHVKMESHVLNDIVPCTDVCYIKDDAYSIVPEGEKSLHAVGEITSEDKEANESIHE